MSMMGKDDKDADPRPADLSNGWEDDSMAEKLHALPGYYTDPGGINPMMSETDHVASQKEFWRFVTRRKTVRCAAPERFRSLSAHVALHGT
jgi:hypothetical protein